MADLEAPPTKIYPLVQTPDGVTCHECGFWLKCGYPYTLRPKGMAGKSLIMETVCVYCTPLDPDISG